jgi:hypothetical protein
MKPRTSPHRGARHRRDSTAVFRSPSRPPRLLPCQTVGLRAGAARVTGRERCRRAYCPWRQPCYLLRSGLRQSARTRCARHQRTFRAERNNHDLATALFDELARRALLVAWRADPVLGQLRELAEARLHQIDAETGLLERSAEGIEDKTRSLRPGEFANPPIDSSGTPGGKLSLATMYCAPEAAAASWSKQRAWSFRDSSGPGRMKRTVFRF